MAEIRVTEKHSVSTVGSDRAEVEIKINSEFPYKFVCAVEDEIYKFIENLKRINEGSPGFVNTPYSEEERKVVHESTRENVWERYQEAFPKSRRTRVGVISYFKKWMQFKKFNKPVREPMAAPVLEEAVKLNKWHKKHILAHGVEPESLEKFHKKWPDLKVPDPSLIQLHRELLSMFAPAVETPPKVETPAGQLKVGDRVLQVKGLAPGHGMGVVEAVRGDGVTTVKFIGSKKVLPMENFILAAPLLDGVS